MKHEIIKGDFEWENGQNDTRVEWKSSEKGRFSFKVLKPNLTQRILIKLKIIKDRKWKNIYSWRPKK